MANKRDEEHIGDNDGHIMVIAQTRISAASSTFFSANSRTRAWFHQFCTYVPVNRINSGGAIESSSRTKTRIQTMEIISLYNILLTKIRYGS